SSSDRGYQIEFVSLRFLTHEGDIETIRRPAWLRIRSAVCCQALQRFSPNLFDIDIGVVTAISVPGECYTFAVGREGRKAFVTLKAGELNYLRAACRRSVLRCMRTEETIKQPPSNEQHGQGKEAKAGLQLPTIAQERPTLFNGRCSRGGCCVSGCRH